MAAPRLWHDSDGRVRAGYNFGDEGKRVGLIDTDEKGTPRGQKMIPVKRADGSFTGGHVGVAEGDKRKEVVLSGGKPEDHIVQSGPSERSLAKAKAIGDWRREQQRKAEGFSVTPSWEKTNVPLAMRGVGSVQQQERRVAFFDNLAQRERMNEARAGLIDAQTKTEEGEGARRDTLTEAQAGKMKSEAGLLDAEGEFKYGQGAQDIRKQESEANRSLTEAQAGKVKSEAGLLDANAGVVKQEGEFKYGQGAQDIRDKESEANRSLTEAQAGKVKSEAGLLDANAGVVKQEGEFKYGQGAQDIRKEESYANNLLKNSETAVNMSRAGLMDAQTKTEQGEGARRDAATAAQSTLARQQAAVAGAQADTISAEAAASRRSSMSDADKAVVAGMGGVATQKPGDALLAMERVGNQFPDGLAKVKDDDPTLAEVAKSLGVSVPEFRRMYERGVAARNRQAASTSGGSVGNAGRVPLE